MGIIIPMADCIDTFAATELAAHSGAFGNNTLPIPSESQCTAGNYKKGRASVCGITAVIEQPRGSYRSGVDSKSGKPWSCQMMAHYGYIAGVTGADGDGLDCFIGGYHASETVFVINQNRPDGGFDEHKVMLAFPDEDTARNAYLNSYERGWSGLGSMIALTLPQFHFWLKYGDRRRPLRPEALPYRGNGTMAMRWDENGNPVGQTLDQVLYGIRRDDAGEGLVYDSLNVSDIEEDADEVAVMDALVTPFGKLGRKIDLLKNIMERAGQSLKPISSQITSPFKQRGVAQVAVIFELSDGQTVSIYFHNPDTTPNKITPTDELISWKWLLNKKDITIVVAPERGQDLNVREVARRIMKLAEKNSAAFQRANARRSESMQAIKSLQDEIAGLEKDLAAAEKDLAVAEFEAEERKIAAAAGPVNDPVKEPENTDGNLPGGDVDMIYRDDGLFTSFIPMSKSGEDAFRVMAEQTEGTGRVLSIHATSVVEQLQQSGHTVRKMKKSDLSDISTDELASELAETESKEFTEVSKPFSSYLDDAEGDHFEAARAFFKAELQGKVVKTVIGPVWMLGSSWQKMKGGGKSDLRSSLIPLVPEILTTGSYKGREELDKGRSDSYVAFHPFVKDVAVGGLTVTTKVKVGEREDGTYQFVAYSLSAKDASQKETASVMDAVGRDAVFRGSGVPSEPTAKPESTSAPLLTVENSIEQKTDSVNQEAEDDSLGRGGINIIILKVVETATGKQLTDLEDGPVNQSTSEGKNSNDKPLAKKNAPWWDGQTKYASVYTIGKSRSRDTLTLEKKGDVYEAMAVQSGVGRSLLNTVPAIVEWLRSSVLVGMGDALSGREQSIDDLKAKLKLVSGEDLLFSTINTADESTQNNDAEDRDFLSAIAARTLPVAAIISGETSAKLKALQEKYSDNVEMIDLIRSAVIARGMAALDATQAFAG